MFGFLLIDKPPGPTSHDMVAGVRRRLGRRVKVGHAGTLDPFASGLLIVCVGPATRLADYAQAAAKRYAATVLLGATSSTDDPEGEISPTAGATPPTERGVREALAGFVGEVQQVPPAHSAVHVAGRRAYKLARAGKAPELPPRSVTIHSIDLVRYEWPRVEIDVLCGAGTYLRALARDVGAALSTGGYCETLRRTAIGDCRVADAVGPADLDPARDLVPPLKLLGEMPRVTVTAAQADALRHGRAFEVQPPLPPGEVALIDADSRLLAIAEPSPDGRRLRPRKVFVTGA